MTPLFYWPHLGAKVRELILNGEQSDEEQKEIIAWHYRQLAKDQEEMPGAPLSLDVEQVPCTLMDVYDIAGQRAHKGDSVRLHTKPGPEYHGRHADRHVQLNLNKLFVNRKNKKGLTLLSANPTVL